MKLTCWICTILASVLILTSSCVKEKNPKCNKNYCNIYNEFSENRNERLSHSYCLVGQYIKCGNGKDLYE